MPLANRLLIDTILRNAISLETIPKRQRECVRKAFLGPAVQGSIRFKHKEDIGTTEERAKTRILQAIRKDY